MAQRVVFALEIRQMRAGGPQIVHRVGDSLIGFCRQFSQKHVRWKKSESNLTCLSNSAKSPFLVCELATLNGSVVLSIQSERVTLWKIMFPLFVLLLPGYII